MSRPKLSIHEAAAALLAGLSAPRGSIVTMVDIDEKIGNVIRVLVAPGYGHVVADIPSKFKGYRVVVAREPAAYPQEASG